MNEPALRSARHEPGFTMLELLIAMGIFTILGTMVIFLMRQSLEVFSIGTREMALSDRLDTVLPLVAEDLGTLVVPESTDAPPQPPEVNNLGGPKRKTRPPPAVAVRLRSGMQKLKDQPEGPTKDLLFAYVAFVADVSEGLDPLLRRSGNSADPQAKDYTPAEVDAAKPDTPFKPTGGLVEICYVAVPEDPARPGILTLYRGFRAPIGDPEKTLLEPSNLDTLEKIRKACRPVEAGLLHFGVRWRRVFASTWEMDASVRGERGETVPYVGTTWDSTRALERSFPLFVGPESLADPSDDVFPRFALLEITIVAPTAFGFGRGDLKLTGGIDKDATRLTVSNTDPLLDPALGTKVRWLKIGAEWMRFETGDVDYLNNTVRVQRGQRGSLAKAHEDGEWIYVGQPDQVELRLPVFRDRYTLLAKDVPGDDR